MSFKLHYDMERNNELCDPEKYYSKFEGVNYHKTIMATRKNVYFNPHKQPRTENQNLYFKLLNLLKLLIEVLYIGFLACAVLMVFIGFLFL